MTRILEVLVAMLLVALLALVVGLALPSSRTYTQTVETNRPLNTAFDMLNGFQRFHDWTALHRLDPNAKFEISGPASGVGAKITFTSDDRQVGNGSWEIIESVPGEKIVFRVIDEAMGTNKTMRFTFERTGRNNRNVEVRQRYRVEYGWNLFARYAGMYVSGNVGNNIKFGLAQLANALASVPRLDYSKYEHEISIVDLPAQNVLKVPTVAKRSNDEIALAMTNQMQWIDKVVADNNLEKAGPMRIVTVDFGTEAYTFEIVQPVRPKGAAEAAEGEAVAAAAEATLPTLELKIEGTGGAENPVQYEQTKPMRAVTTKWIGPSPGLSAVRDTIRAWALVRAHQPDGQPFDEYKVAIPDMLNEDAEFQAYWPLRTP
jgi:hypothetical protein